MSLESITNQHWFSNQNIRSHVNTPHTQEPSDICLGELKRLSLLVVKKPKQSSFHHKREFQEWLDAQAVLSYLKKLFNPRRRDLVLEFFSDMHINELIPSHA